MELKAALDPSGRSPALASWARGGDPCGRGDYFEGVTSTRVGGSPPYHCRGGGSPGESLPRWPCSRASPGCTCTTTSWAGRSRASSASSPSLRSSTSARIILGGASPWSSAASVASKADIVLRGYSGWNSRRALQVIDKIFPKDSAVQPSLVIVYFGGNDSIAAHSSGLGPHVPLEEYMENMRKIAEHLKSLSDKTRVIFLSCPPLNEEMLRRSTSTALSKIVRTNETCRLYSEACVSVCKEMGIKVVDLWNALQKRDDWETACFTDGLHLSEEGSKIVVEEILRILKEAEWDPCLHWKAMPTEFGEDSPYDLVSSSGQSTINPSEWTFHRKIPWE